MIIHVREGLFLMPVILGYVCTTVIHVVQWIHLTLITFSCKKMENIHSFTYLNNRANMLIQPAHQIWPNFFAKFSFSWLIALTGFTALHSSLAASKQLSSLIFFLTSDLSFHCEDSFSKNFGLIIFTQSNNLLVFFGSFRARVRCVRNRIWQLTL